MPLKLVGAESTPPEPRCVVVRAVSELSAVLAIANADIPVLVVLRVDTEERQRIADVFAGWVSGASGTLDWLGANTVVLRSPRSPALRLISHGLAAAAERFLTAAAPDALTRDDEIRLRRQAAAGSVDARRRLIDAYAEIATLVALWLRPPDISANSATRRAHRELDLLVERLPTAPLLVELVDGIAARPTTADD
jgi:hypothetical protein